MPTLTAPELDMGMDVSTSVIDIPPPPHGASPGVWTFNVRSRTGTQIAALELADPGGISERLLDWPVFDLGYPKTETDTLELCSEWVVEVHAERNGRLMFAGPFVGYQGSAKEGSRRRSAIGVLGYLDHRVRLAEELVVVNFFRNPRFDDGLEGWVGRTPAGVSGPPTGTLDEDTETGTQSVRLDDGESIAQALLFTAFHFDFTLKITARVKVDADVEPGVFITVDVPGVSATAGYTSAMITADTPRGVWTNVECSIDVDGTTQPNIVIYPAFHGLPGGPVIVDHCVAEITHLRDLLADNSINVDLPEPVRPQLDYSRVVSNIVAAAGSDLNLGISAPIIGQLTTDDKGAPQTAWDALKKQLEPGAFEIDVVASRYVRTLVTAAPRIGRDIPAEELVLTPNVTDAGPANCAVDYARTITATRPRGRVWCPGDDGMVGQAYDPDAWGGFLLEDVIPGEAGLTLDQLNGMARTNLRKDSGSVEVLVLTDIDGDLLDTVRNGDRVAVSIDDADLQLDEVVFRVVARDIDPVSDTFQVTLNPEPVP